MDISQPATHMHRRAKDINRPTKDLNRPTKGMNGPAKGLNHPAIHMLQFVKCICPPTMHMHRGTVHAHQLVTDSSCLIGNVRRLARQSVVGDLPSVVSKMGR
jgi:hypothetical protein